MTLGRFVSSLTALALVFTFAASSAAAEHPHGPFGNILLLKAKGALIMEVADISIQANTIPDESEDLDSLDGNFKKSLAEARGHKQLMGALKDYYAALRAFLTGLQPQAGESAFVYRSRVSALETQAKSTGERLGVELQALGADS